MTPQQPPKDFGFHPPSSAMISSLLIASSSHAIALSNGRPSCPAARLCTRFCAFAGSNPHTRSSMPVAKQLAVVIKWEILKMKENKIRHKHSFSKNGQVQQNFPNKTKRLELKWNCLHSTLRVEEDNHQQLP